MCTVISKSIDRLYFGRNMDIEKGFGEEMVFVPRNFPLSFKAERTVEHHNAFMGIGAVSVGVIRIYPLYPLNMKHIKLLLVLLVKRYVNPMGFLLLVM